MLKLSAGSVVKHFAMSEGGPGFNPTLSHVAWS